MLEGKGMWEGLMDFSFRVYATPRTLKSLYAMHLQVGLIAAVAWSCCHSSRPRYKACLPSSAHWWLIFSGFSTVASSSKYLRLCSA